MNQRALDKLIPTLSPPIPPSDEAALRGLSDFMGDSGFTVSGTDRTAGVLRVTFDDGARRLTWTMPEIAELAASLGAGVAFPWDTELSRQGNR